MQSSHSSSHFLTDSVHKDATTQPCPHVRLSIEPPGARRHSYRCMLLGRLKRHEGLTVEVIPKTRIGRRSSFAETTITRLYRQRTRPIDPKLDGLLSGGMDCLDAVTYAKSTTCQWNAVKRTNPQQKRRINPLHKLSRSKTSACVENCRAKCSTRVK